MSLLNRKKWKALEFKKNLKGEEALEAVKRYGYDLQYVEVQTEEICLEAVKRDGDVLRFVKEQTKENLSRGSKARWGCT